MSNCSTPNISSIPDDQAFENGEVLSGIEFLSSYSDFRFFKKEVPNVDSLSSPKLNTYSFVKSVSDWDIANKLTSVAQKSPSCLTTWDIANEISSTFFNKDLLPDYNWKQF